MVSPNDTFRWYFGKDPREETDDGRYVLIRFNSAGFWRQLDQERPSKDDPAWLDKLISIADKLVVGASFEWKGAAESLTVGQIRDIAAGAFYSAVLSEEDKKKSKSSPQSPADDSVTNVPEGGA